MACVPCITEEGYIRHALPVLHGPHATVFLLKGVKSSSCLLKERVAASENAVTGKNLVTGLNNVAPSI